MARVLVGFTLAVKLHWKWIMTGKALAVNRNTEAPETDEHKTSAPVSETAIAVFAYQLWQKRGCPSGSPEHDWHTAEEQLRELSASR